MPTFDSSGVPINYVVEGSGPPIVLVHGFASSLDGNWRAPGIIDALVKAGRQVIALDCRGHGKSGKPHDPHAYDGWAMSDDVPALMNHLGVQQADLMGYSMGGVIVTSLLVRHPERFRSVIIAGIGDAVVTDGGPPRERAAAIAQALESRAAGGANVVGRAFREFAERNGNDLAALGAMQRANRERLDVTKLRDVKLPVMVLVGENDTLVGKADRLAATIPGAKHVKVPGDHLTAVGQPQFRQAMVDFLAEHSPVRTTTS